MTIGLDLPSQRRRCGSLATRIDRAFQRSLDVYFQVRAAFHQEHSATAEGSATMPLLEQGWFALLSSLGESAPFVILGLLLAGVIHEFVPAKVLKKRLGGSGVAPVSRAVGLGALLPICSCSTIPLGLGMARSGAGNGTALAFMTSAPALSPITIVLGISVLGPMLLGTYSLLVLCGSLLLGVVGNRLLVAATNQNKAGKMSSSCGCGCGQSKDRTGKRIANAVHWALFDLGSEVSLSLLVGLLLATIILVFTPSQWILEVAGRPSPLAILAVILLTVPAYTCSVPALLIAGSLIAKGADPSVAVAFLIAGPATNFGELNSIRVGLGMRSAAFYFAAVVSLAIASAFLVQLLPTALLSSDALVAESSSHHHHGHAHIGSEVLGDQIEDATPRSVDTWRWPFVCIIMGLASSALFSQYIKRGATQEHSHESRQAEASDVALLTVNKQMSGGWNR